MKKIVKLIIFITLLLCAMAVSAEENLLTVELGTFDYGAIMIPSEAKFELHSLEGECVAEAKTNIDSFGSKMTLEFNISDYKENETYYLIPKEGITELSYVGRSYGIDEKVPLNTADGMFFPVEAIPLYKPKTGVRADSVEVNVHITKKPKALALLKFELYNKDGELLSTKTVEVNKNTDVAKMVFSVPEYYTGENFYLTPVSGMTDTVYYTGTYMPNERISLDTYAGILENGIPVIGNVFDVSVEVALLEIPDLKQVPDDVYVALVEEFVNGSGIESKTDYFIWVSKKDYKVNVLIRNDGIWDYHTSFDCTIGKPSTPTITGVFEYFAYQDRWTYKNYYVGPIMRFAPKGYALHSTLIKYDGQPYDARLRQKLSLGCVRLAPENIKWLVDYIPLHTRVYITE
ncbi:MAG: L,D-transpeptidase [Eubacteriales bacterium]|nr:L,D-transpeptidase [Eubacteriales bacterium]